MKGLGQENGGPAGPSAHPDRPIELPIQPVRRRRRRRAGAASGARGRRRGAGDGADVLERLRQLAVDGGREAERGEPRPGAGAGAGAAGDGRSGGARGGEASQRLHVGDGLPELRVDVGGARHRWRGCVRAGGGLWSKVRAGVKDAGKR